MHADHPVRLPRAHAYQRPVFHECDGVGLDVLDCFPGKGQVGQFSVGGRAFGGRGPRRRVFGNVVRRLHQNAAAQRAHVVIRRARRGRGRLHRQNPQIALALQDFQRVAVVAGSNYHFVENRPHGLGRLRRYRPVESHDAAESRHRVAFVGQLVRFGQVIPRGQAARVGVLDDANGRPVVIAHRAPGGVGVHQVVERQFPPVQLLGAGQAAGAAAGRHVQRAPLVRILPIAQRRYPRETDGNLLRHLCLGVGAGRQVVGNGGVIDGNVLEGFGGQAATLLHIQRVAGQRVAHPAVIRRVNYHCHRREVFRRRP